MAISFSGAAAAYGKIANQTNVLDSVPDLGGSAATKPGLSFAEMVEQAAQSGLDQARQSENISALALQGKSELSDVVAAVNGAETVLQTAISIRDRLVTGIQEIMRMPV